MSTTLTKLYQIREIDVVKLILSIGEGQIGASTVMLDRAVLADKHRNSLELNINKPGENLIGRTLICTTTVSDVRRETNETSITYELSGGTQPLRQTLQESVESEGGIIIYVATFRFYRQRA